MLKHFLLLISAISFLTSCSSARQSHEVQAIRAPMAGYLKMTCQELLSEQLVLLSKVEASGVRVDEAHDSDQGVEVITWILFAPAAFFLEGNEAEASQYAAEKGQLESINEALRVNKCAVSEVIPAR